MQFRVRMTSVRVRTRWQKPALSDSQKPPLQPTQALLNVFNIRIAQICKIPSCCSTGFVCKYKYAI